MLFVIAYHVWPKTIRMGYLGVDIFFVISGYLITKLVKSEIIAGHFSFSKFYSRRIRRLLPAAYSTFAITTVLATMLLNRRELRDFLWQLIGAVTFSANFTLWRQTGYFAGAADMKPFLHLWSLAIEEQYYLLLPAALVFTRRKYWIPGSILIFAGSLGLFLYRTPHHPLATFYLLPTRAWEIALGSVGALAFVPGHFRRPLDILYWPSVLLLILIPGDFIDLGTVAACIATLIVLLRNHQWLSSTLPVRGLAWVGNFSYSLYLVHWPILALFRNVWFGEVPFFLELTYLVLALALGYLQYRYVEEPWRKSQFRLTWSSTTCIAAASLLLISMPYFALSQAEVKWKHTYDAGTNAGVHPSCGYNGDFVPRPECRTTERPSVFLWGDSFAMQLGAGLALVTGDAGLMQAARSVCAPLPSIAPVNRSNYSLYNRRWAEICTDFNQSVMAYLEKSKNIELVVLSSAFTSYVTPDDGRLLQNRSTMIDPDPTVTLAVLKRTADTLRSAGKRVVLVSPAPTARVDLARCQERRLNGQLRLGPLADCKIPLALYYQRTQKVQDFLRRVPAEAGVPVIRLENYLCADGYCDTIRGGQILYHDAAHLSTEGSRLIARQIGLFELIQAKAQ